MKSRKFIGILLAFLMFASIFAIVGFSGVASATSAPYTVTFNEAKLLTGTTWGIVLSNSTKTITATNKTISTGGSISESLYNGTYYFNVSGTPWWFNSTHGKFTVSGATQTITINFIENFSATFTEAKLPSGTKWGVNSSLGTFSNTTTASGGSIAIKEANSTTSYSFSVIGTPWWFNSTKLSVEFNKNSTFTINFIENFTVTVKENGLYPGISWGAGIGSVSKNAQQGGTVLLPRISNAGTVQPSTITNYMITYYVSSPYTTNTNLVLKYKDGSWQFIVYSIFYYNISFPNMVYIPDNVNGPIYYSNISLTSNITIEVNFTPWMHIVTIKGYTNPNGTNVSTLNFIGLVRSKGGYTAGNVTSNKTGFYEITTTEYANVFFYKNGYSPQVVRILSNQSVQWFNITLSKISFSWNTSQVLSIKNYNNVSWIYNFNITNVPINFTYIKNGIYFANIKQNEFIAFANLSGLPPFPGRAVLKQGSPIPPPLILNVTLKLHPNQKYVFFVYTNKLNNPTKFYVNASSTGYTTIDLNKYTDNFTLDPLVEYSAPQAIITAPTAVAYDSAVLISGANSIASTNATITNYTWKITGPQNQLYTEYGKTITMYFSVTGIYTITLTVTDSNGLTNTTRTTITVVSANQDLNIQISYSLTILPNGYYQYNVTVNAKDNVSISQFLASVDSVYVNATLISQKGYTYYYVVKFNPDAFGYGNHTIKFEAINSLDGYNTAITYATFGSLDQGGIMAYILGHIALTIVIIIFIIIVLLFIYVEYKHRIIKKISNAKRITKTKNSKRVRK